MLHPWFGDAAVSRALQSVLLQLIPERVRSRTDEFRLKFAEGRPFRHAVIDDFLDAAFLAGLAEQFPVFDRAAAANEFGEVGRKAVRPDLPALGGAYATFDGLLRSREFLDWIGRITGIPDLLYDPVYAGGGTHENLDGQDLDPHVDFNYHPQFKWHRRLNLILFLNEDWEEAWGGALELQLDPALPANENLTKTVVPKANRCVIFETTEYSWHGFRRIQLPEEKKHLSRRSIAVYFYTRERPAEETAASHATIYVQRPLPEHIRAGHTLSEEDVEEIQTLLARRDRQIRFLYEREKEFMARVEGSVSYRLGLFLTWPLRKVWRGIKKGA